MYETGDLILVGLGAAVLGFGAAVVITLPALKKAAKETEQAESEVMILKRIVDATKPVSALREEQGEAPSHKGG